MNNSILVINTFSLIFLKRKCSLLRHKCMMLTSIYFCQPEFGMEVKSPPCRTRVEPLYRTSGVGDEDGGNGNNNSSSSSSNNIYIYISIYIYLYLYLYLYLSTYLSIDR